MKRKYARPKDRTYVQVWLSPYDLRLFKLSPRGHGKPERRKV